MFPWSFPCRKERGRDEKAENALNTKKGGSRRLVRMAVVAGAGRQFFHVGLVLPVQGIYGAVERGGATGTRVIAREWNPDFRVTQLFYLTGSEEATVLADTSLGLLAGKAALSALWIVPRVRRSTPESGP